MEEAVAVAEETTVIFCVLQDIHLAAAPFFHCDDVKDDFGSVALHSEHPREGGREDIARHASDKQRSNTT